MEIFVAPKEECAVRCANGTFSLSIYTQCTQIVCPNDCDHWTCRTWSWSGFGWANGIHWTIVIELTFVTFATMSGAFVSIKYRLKFIFVTLAALCESDEHETQLKQKRDTCTYIRRTHATRETRRVVACAKQFNGKWFVIIIINFLSFSSVERNVRPNIRVMFSLNVMCRRNCAVVKNDEKSAQHWRLKQSILKCSREQKALWKDKAMRHRATKMQIINDSFSFGIEKEEAKHTINDTMAGLYWKIRQANEKKKQIMKEKNTYTHKSNKKYTNNHTAQWLIRISVEGKRHRRWRSRRKTTTNRRVHKAQQQQHKSHWNYTQWNRNKSHWKLKTSWVNVLVVVRQPQHRSLVLTIFAYAMHTKYDTRTNSSYNSSAELSLQLKTTTEYVMYRQSSENDCITWIDDDRVASRVLLSLQLKTVLQCSYFESIFCAHEILIGHFDKLN